MRNTQRAIGYKTTSPERAVRALRPQAPGVPGDETSQDKGAFKTHGLDAVVEELISVGRSRGWIAAVTAVFLISVLPSLGDVQTPGAYEGARDPGALSSDTPFPPATAEERYRQLIVYSDVVVLRNTNSADAVAIADDFIATRAVPAQNVCDIPTSTAETIDRAAFDVLRAQVDACLTGQGLYATANYLVTTKGFPLRVADVTDKNAAIDSELALLGGPYESWINQTFWLDNPYFTAVGPFSRAAYGHFLVTRLTGFTRAMSQDLIDLATAGIGRKGQFVLDTDPTKGGGYTIGNTWMIDAAAILQARGFDVLLDQNNSFVTGQSRVAGYTSWGSNDATWYLNAIANPSFEADADLDGLPDGWTAVNETVSTISKDSVTANVGTWSVLFTKSAPTANETLVYQDLVPLPDTRYYAVVAANYSGITAPGGVRLRIQALDASDSVLATINGTALTGTSNWRSTAQMIYEPVPGAAKVRFLAVLDRSGGTVRFDSASLTPIRPHMGWNPGALAETYVSTGGRSFTYGTGYGQSLVADLLMDGATGLKGYVYEPYLNAVAHPDLLFSRLTDGRNLAESFGAASELLLSWMDVIVGDPKFDPYDLAYVPDLEVSVANLTISPTAAVSGALFTADAFVGNLGNYPAENVSVSLFRGDPRTGGTLLSRQVVTVDYGLTSPLAFEWDSLGDSGSFDLCVFADSADDFFEVSEANNIACQAILLDPALSLPLVEGWNLISLPLVPSRPDLPWVFRSIAGDYDLVRAFSAGTVEPWRLHDSARPGPELLAVDPALGLWIHVTRPGGTTLLVGGTEPATTSIPLSPGWNLVGFPAGGPRQAAVAFVGVPVSRVETFDPAGDPYRLRPVGWAEDLMPGQGLWVRADAATTWVVPY